MINGRNLFNLILLITMLVMVIISFDYNPKARLFPLAVGAVTFVMLLWQLIMDQFPKLKEKMSLTNTESEKEKKEEKNPEQKKKHWLVAFQCLIAMVILTVLLIYVSYLIAVPVFLLLFIWLIGKAKLMNALGVSILVSGFMYVLFDLVLHANI